MTLYGNFLGSSGTVTFNGQNCLRVLQWGAPYLWYQTITVQLGPNCGAGTGNFVANGSNGIPFTVRAGNIYFVATNGSDTNSGSISSPFKTIPGAYAKTKPGDIVYAESGVTQSSVDNFNACLDIEKSGSAGLPIAIGSYPGASPQPQIGGTACQYGARVPEIGVSPSYLTFFGISFLQPSGDMALDFYGAGIDSASNIRVVGNKFQCPAFDGEDGCFTAQEVSGLNFLGNEVANSGLPAGSSKQAHAVYFTSDTNHVVAAWNSIHNNTTCRAIQFHSSPIGGTSGHNQFDLHVHDNVIHDDPCDGLNFATVDPSQGVVEAYNNLIYHTGIGPAPPDGDGDYSCFYMAYLTNAGPVGGGTVQFYNNTLYDCGAHANSFNQGALVVAGGEPSLLLSLQNNIVYQLAGENLGSGAGWTSNFVSGSNNLLFGAAVPGFLTSTVVADPLFVGAPGNFHLQSTSPAGGDGLTIPSLTNDLDGKLRPSPPSIGAYER